jgi:protein NUD1
VLTELDAAGVVLPRLRVLRVSENRLQGQLNVAAFPNLRTLYADGNSLVALAKVGRLTKLENLSMRNQSGRAL